MAENNQLTEAEAIRKLSEHTSTIIKEFTKLAIAYNINIITGSMPKLVGDTLYNAGHLCQRNGTVDKFEKLHITGILFN